VVPTTPAGILHHGWFHDGGDLIQPNLATLPFHLNPDPGAGGSCGRGQTNVRRLGSLDASRRRQPDSGHRGGDVAGAHREILRSRFHVKLVR
jgi:hypothetical protein